MIKTHIRGALEWRINSDNMDDLKIAIMPDDSREGLEAMETFVIRPEVIKGVSAIQLVA